MMAFSGCTRSGVVKYHRANRQKACPVNLAERINAAASIMDEALAQVVDNRALRVALAAQDSADRLEDRIDLQNEVALQFEALYAERADALAETYAMLNETNERLDSLMHQRLEASVADDNARKQARADLSVDTQSAITNLRTQRLQSAQKRKNGRVKARLGLSSAETKRQTEFNRYLREDMAHYKKMLKQEVEQILTQDFDR